jgi:hypothetical protein
VAFDFAFVTNGDSQNKVAQDLSYMATTISVGAMFYQYFIM